MFEISFSSSFRLVGVSLSSGSWTRSNLLQFSPPMIIFVMSSEVSTLQIPFQFTMVLGVATPGIIQ